MMAIIVGPPDVVAVSQAVGPSLQSRVAARPRALAGVGVGESEFVRAPPGGSRPGRSSAEYPGAWSPPVCSWASGRLAV